MPKQQFYNEDEALQEVHDEIYKAEEERAKSGFATLEQKTKFAIAIAISAVLLLTYFEKINAKTGAVLIAVIAIIIYLIAGRDNTRKELTFLECLMRLDEQLRFLQYHPIGNIPQVPPGEIHVKPIGRKQWFQGKGMKRSFAVDLYDAETDVLTMYNAEVDIFTGDIVTFRLAPEGVRGDEKKDLIYIPTPEQRAQKMSGTYTRPRAR